MEIFTKTFNVNGKTYERQVILETVDEFDESGNLIHSKRYSDHGEETFGEEFIEYDSSGKETHYKRYDERIDEPGGIEWWDEYDEKGNLIRCKYNDGTEDIWTYDERGNEIYHKESNGDENWYEYDENNNRIHERCTGQIDFECWMEYDKYGNEIHYKDNDGDEYWHEYKYDEKGNKIYDKSGDDEEWYEYDDKGHMIHSKDEKGLNRWYEYDKCGEQSCEKWYDNTKVMWRREFDENGLEVRNEGLHGKEHYFEYEFYDNGKVKKCTVYIMKSFN